MSSVQIIHVETSYDPVSPIGTFQGSWVATVVGSNGRRCSGRGWSKSEAIANATRKVVR